MLNKRRSVYTTAMKKNDAYLYELAQKALKMENNKDIE